MFHGPSAHLGIIIFHIELKVDVPLFCHLRLLDTKQRQSYVADGAQELACPPRPYLDWVLAVRLGDARSYVEVWRERCDGSVGAIAVACVVLEIYRGLVGCYTYGWLLGEMRTGHVRLRRMPVWNVRTVSSWPT